MELFIVILGISIAYQLNIVYEKGINHKLELTAVQNLKKEIQINIDEFESLDEYRTQITNDSKALLAHLRKGPISLDTANKYVFRLIRTSTPDLQQEAANFYLNSNYSDANIDLKNELLTLKTYFQELLDVSDGYSGRKDSKFKEALYGSVDFPSFEVKDLNAINSLKFKNIIWDQTSDEHELNRLFHLSFEKLKEIRSQVDELLKDE